MEEKERYELFGEFGIIHDTSPNAKCMLLNKFQTCEILNKQDKENQQLKQQLAITEKALELACELRDDWGGEKYSGTKYNNYYDYFMVEAEEMLENE